MNENLGSLYFAFRAQLAQWKNDLAQADAEYMRYKAKWETPVAFRGMGGGGGGSGGSMAGVSAGTGHAGLNVGGTSNGDVTWRLADSVDRHQDREDKATSVAKRLMKGSGSSSRFDADDTPAAGAALAGDFIQQSRMRMELGDAAEMSRRKAVLDKQQDMASELMQQHGASSLSADAPAKASLWKTKIPIQALVRGTVAGIVVDAIAGMATNESTYSQSMALAGNNQGLQSRAEIDRFKNGLGSVPFVGGILKNLASPFTTPIETQTMLGERQVSYQDAQRAAGAGRTATHYEAAATRMGPDIYGAGLLRAYGKQTAIRAQFESETDALRQKFEASNPVPQLHNWGLGDLIGISGSRANTARYDREVNARSDALTRFNQGRNDVLAGRLDENGANVDTLMQQGRYQTSSQMTEIHRAQSQNAFDPIGGQARFESESFRDLLDYSIRPGMSTLEKSSLRNEGSLAIERLKGSQRDIVENYRWGEGRTYNPYIESTLTFTDRDPKTMQDNYDSLTKAIQDLVTVMRDRLGGN